MPFCSKLTIYRFDLTERPVFWPQTDPPPLALEKSSFQLSNVFSPLPYLISSSPFSLYIFSYIRVQNITVVPQAVSAL
jgi:hypothetical protein